jgi:hypothetical protein
VLPSSGRWFKTRRRPKKLGVVTRCSATIE